uniref:PyrF3 n=1 Tax=Streptomyces rugosporus TaxID=295838 RepID=K7QQB3_STRRG|nr:PyrF3 [Streptomyces rugosporus]
MPDTDRGPALTAADLIKVLVVDDEPMVCTHVMTILNAAPDLTVVGQANDGAEAVELVLHRKPDVVLMDLRMPGVDGVTATRRIVQLPDPPVVVVLTTLDDDASILSALRAGAAGFLLKATPPEDLVNLVRVASEGHTVLSSVATGRLLSVAGDRDRARSRQVKLIGDRRLTPRETEVLTCLGEGMSNLQIARRLCLTEATVKGHVSRLLVKLECDNRTQAGLLAFELGLGEQQ